MMIPIPRRGVLHGGARRRGGARRCRGRGGRRHRRIGRELVPLPEGDSYLGFLFARGGAPAEVEAALREAHRRLELDIRAPLPTV